MWHGPAWKGASDWRGTLGLLLPLAAIELSYALVTRALMPSYFSGAGLELYITAARLLTLPLYWKLYRPLIRSRTARREMLGKPWFLVGVAMLLSVPLLFGKDDWTDPVVRTAFVLTSLVVGLREEIVYRAIVQNLLEERLGKAGAILLASAVFALYHYGFGGWPYTWHRFLELFLFGCIFGVLYRVSGSLLLAALLHALIDVIYAVSPLIPQLLPRTDDLWAEALVLLIFLVWARRRSDDSPRSGAE
jgi:membrane protease YdiL (CAAX protease family)